MNTIIIKLVLVETETGSVAMCKILTVVAVLLNACTLILLSLVATDYHLSS